MVLDGFNFFNVIWIVFILWSIIPIFRQRKIQNARFKRLRRFEQLRGSRVITLIHRQETLSILGFPISRFINIDDAEAVLRAIRLTPDSKPIDLILHTPGGLVLASEQIARAIKRHPAKVTVFVPHYAMSGGTMIALAADEIVIDDNAVLGPVDPQLGGLPAASILRAVGHKSPERVSDKTLIMADIAEKAVQQVTAVVEELLDGKLEPDDAHRVAGLLTEGTWTHDYPITCETLNKLGLQVSCAMPREVYGLMDLYPQNPTRRPSVQYVPVPYGEED